MFLFYDSKSSDRKSIFESDYIKMVKSLPLEGEVKFIHRIIVSYNYNFTPEVLVV